MPLVVTVVAVVVVMSKAVLRKSWARLGLCLAFVIQDTSIAPE